MLINDYLTRLFNVAEVYFSWATPARTSKATLLKPRTSLVLAEYDLAIYERTVQVSIY